MVTGALQIVITIWLSVHPVTFTLPRLYPSLDMRLCQQHLTWLLQHRRDNRQHMELACVPTDKRAL